VLKRKPNPDIRSGNDSHLRIAFHAYFGEAGHLFRRKPVTCFGASRSAMLTPSERSDV
jgi:hypothetical protein